MSTRHPVAAMKALRGSHRVARRSAVSSAHRMVLAGLVLIAVMPALLVAGVGSVLQKQRADVTAQAAVRVAEQQATAAAGLALPVASAASAAAVTLATLAAPGQAHEIIDAAGICIEAGGDPQARAWPASRPRRRCARLLRQRQRLRLLQRCA